MVNPDQMYQLRQIRNQELLMEAEQARITQERVRNQRLFEYDKARTTMLKLTLRYARYIGYAHASG
jgi:hypothetical protein